jgi:hypothetical protein
MIYLLGVEPQKLLIL